MIQSMHKFATGTVAKVMLALLTLMFIGWGGEGFMTSSTPNHVATVGKSKISVQEYQHAVAEEANNLRRMLGKSYNSEMLQAFGVPQRALQTLVQKYLLREEQAALGIRVPESAILHEISKESAFKNKDGSFDAGQFHSILAANGMTEAQYIGMLRDEMANRSFTQALIGNMEIPDEAVNIAYAQQKETRVLDVLYFPKDMATNASNPTEAELQTYYDKHKDNFKTAEYRSFSVLMLDAANIVNSAPVSDQEIKNNYEEHKADLQQPEKRIISQLVFDSKEKAEQAYVAAKAGKAMAEFGAGKPEQVTISTAETIPEISKAVFALKQGEYSAPVQTDFGWHLLRLDNVTPAHQLTFEEAKTDIAKELQQEKGQDAAYQLSNTMQDDLAGGSSLEDTAKAAKADIKRFDGLDKAGKTAKGDAASLPIDAASLIQIVFSTAAGEISNLQDNGKGVYYAVRVDNVKEAAVKPLADVKEEVKLAIESSQKQDALKKLADGAAKAMADKKTIESVAAMTHAQLLADQSISRANASFGSDIVLDAPYTSRLFELHQGEATEAHALADGSYVIAALKTVKQGDVNAEGAAKEKDALKDTLTRQYLQEVFSAYLKHLKDKHGVEEIAPATLQQIAKQ